MKAEFHLQRVSKNQNIFYRNLATQPPPLLLSSSILTSWEFQVRGFHYSRDLSPRVLLLRVPATSKSDSGLFTLSSRRFNQNALQTGKPD